MNEKFETSHHHDHLAENKHAKIVLNLTPLAYIF